MGLFVNRFSAIEPRAPSRKGSSLPLSVAICAVALLVEASIGYPPALFAAIGHPVTWIGAALSSLDRRFNRESDPHRRRRANGMLAMAGVVALTGGIGLAIQASLATALPTIVAALIAGLLASSCLAQRSLDQHVRAVAGALQHDGLPGARKAVSMIVGRDTEALDEAGVARAAIESLAENFADGIVAPAFWIAVGGLAGGLAYKAVNTADSMIGHRTPRHEAFGFAAAKLDDAVNWPAARLAALWIVLAACLTPGASGTEAWRILRRDARGHASPNAGWPEAAMAGALGITLGGSRIYAGRVVADATMGDGASIIGARTIRTALRVYRIACAVNLAAAISLVAMLHR